MEQIKEYILERFNYCRAIAEDIVKHNACLGVLNHAKKFAQIESPMTGEIDATWIRVEFNDIYIFIQLDEDAFFGRNVAILNGEVWYQLDPECAYGAELIDVRSVEDFYEKLHEVNSSELEKHYGAYSEIEIQPGSYRNYAT